MPVLRSLLFVPGSRERMLENSGATRADALVLDLEDAVAGRQKVAARAMVRRWLPALANRRRSLFVRVNSLRSGMTRDDLLAVVSKPLAGVVVPKVESPQDLRDLDVLLREAEMENGVRPGEIATLPLIESARGVLRCEEIVQASDRIIGIAIGGEDYTRDIGAVRDAGGAALQHIRGVVVTVAAAYGLIAIDTPYSDFKDEAGLTADASVARGIGLKGKFAIHPSQIEIINRAFTPSRDEVDEAKRIVEAFKSAGTNGAGAISLDGRMIDAAIVERARAVIAAGKARR